MAEIKEINKTEYRKITIKTTDGATLTGETNIGAQDRVSDIFNNSENQFLILTKSEHKGGSDKILIINKNHIVWAEPE